MSKNSKYLLVSLPTSISPSSSKDEAFAAFQSTVTDAGTTYPFVIPTFKIGTLDALVQQAEDLVKLDGACEGVVNKVGESLRSLYEGDEDRVQQHKTINSKPVDQYLQNFQWNQIKYRSERSIADLIDLMQKEIAAIDNDTKAKINQYNQVKTNLAASQRRQTGNLSTRSLATIIKPNTLINDSEYLDSHIIAVPNPMVKDFLKSYESLTEFVVPRSATELASDSEFTLFSVVVFKKFSTEFVHKCREKRWTPRDYKYKAGGKEEEAREVEALEKDEKKLWNDALRLSGTNYAESAMIWVHVLALRVFVETVLRYGLPLDFVCGIIHTTPKLAKKAKQNLDANYSYLGGNAFERDSKGRLKKDDQSLTHELSTAGHLGDGAAEYSAYVYYEFDIV